MPHSRKDSSVWGFSVTQIPDSVQTLGELVGWFAREKGLALAALLRLFWTEPQSFITMNMDTVTVRRLPQIDLRFPDASWFPMLSRQHCVFSFRNGQWYLTDTSSTNHIPLKPDVPTLLVPGDVITFCRDGSAFVFDPPSP